MVDDYIVKVVQDLVILDQTSFVKSFFGLQHVGNVELVQRLDFERFVLVDYYSL